MTSGSHPPPDLSRTFDVLVIGGGKAALCAAMTAREAGATVLLLESSPREFRGGNIRHTRNLRYFHESGNWHLTGPYPEDEFWNDLLLVTKGQTNEELARFAIRESKNIGMWMEQHGCRFQPAMRGTLHLARTNAFFLGGGKALRISGPSATPSGAGSSPSSRTRSPIASSMPSRSTCSCPRCSLRSKPGPSARWRPS